MPELAYVNGDLMPIENAVVPIEDRGYQFGDAVYEFVASYDGRLFMLDAHLDRLARSMRELSMAPVPRAKIAAAVDGLLGRSGFPRAGIYIQISRGVAPRNHAFRADLPPQVVMTVRPVAEIPEKKRAAGASAITVPDMRWGRCDIKTVQLLANSLAKQRALEAGHDDAIFVADQGVVREGTSSNVFIVSNGRLTTHPLTNAILPGITRMVVLDICRETGLAVDEACFGTDALYGADEVFFTGTVTEILPVVSIDGKTIGQGNGGPITRRLYDLLRRKASGHASG